MSYYLGDAFSTTLPYLEINNLKIVNSAYEKRYIYFISHIVSLYI